MDHAATGLDTGRPFTRAAGRRAGLTDRQLGSARFTRILDGIYVDAAVPLSPAVMAAALSLATPPGSIVSHASAARWWGFPIPSLADEHVTVRSREHRFKRQGVTCHVARGSERFHHAADVLVSSPAQCFVELASLLSLVDLVVVGDWLVRTRRLRPADLIRFCDASTTRRAAAARRAAAFVRDGVDSPMESRLRVLLVLAGLPEPVVNLSIRDVRGIPVRRYDLSWPAVRLVVEYDGRHHVERIEQWEKDLARREQIEDDDWRILVITSKGIYERPGDTVARVHRQLLLRRMPGTPRHPRGEWRRHFPERPQPSR
ncbi:hypothetical protein [Nocardioides jiangxiensis]|uniref:DUF559 domain-containing protein n=1 Tax=Nocardioides jiangxiensis TaxID=3064524 RepID=A0ABT9AY82_9ACTN|nr:hypothetical protein [Nocardioides sp. WY-20]MDO7867529.1 hypothetical protein [Nocardioides sp. WY-20]